MKRMILVLILAAGCSAHKADLSGEAIDVEADLKSDLWKNTRFLGNFELGRASKGIAYHNRPKYRSIAFSATGGTTVDIRVHSDQDAVAWLFDYRGKLIRYNDDADDSTYDSHIHVKLPASNGFYYLYFREYAQNDATFGFQLAAAPESGLAGRAQEAWEAASGSDTGVDPLEVPLTQLPAAARAQGDADLLKHPEATLTGYALPVGSETVYVVYGGVEEYGWLDIFTAAGKRVVHGECGDGGTSVTAWGGAAGPHY
ncbi:MAG TPA: hypothetical protein VMZ28_07680 [Kofleriaceae bacterium]|nr:hypothetical protein [Kofleriaceae bacterium]